MRHVQTRREMIEQVVSTYGQTTIRSLVESIAADNDISHIDAADIMLDAWESTRTLFVADAQAMSPCQVLDARTADQNYELFLN